MASWNVKDKKPDWSSLQYQGSLENTTLYLDDLSFLAPQLQRVHEPLSIYADVSGSHTGLRVRQLRVSSPQNTLSVDVSGRVNHWQTTRDWHLDVRRMDADAARLGDTAASMGAGLKPDMAALLKRLGHLRFTGEAAGGRRQLSVKGSLHTDGGNADIQAGRDADRFFARVETQSIQLGHILDNQKLGTIATRLAVEGPVPDGRHDIALTAKGEVPVFEYNGYQYHNLNIDGTLSLTRDLALTGFDGKLNMKDGNGSVELNGSIRNAHTVPSADLVVRVRDLNPSALKLSNRWRNATFSFDAAANFTGKNINSANGQVKIDHFLMDSEAESYQINHLTVDARTENAGHVLQMSSDFGEIEIDGFYDYGTLPQSIAHVVARRLPTLPGLPPNARITPHNHFTIHTTLYDTEWLRRLLGVPIQIFSPIHLTGSVDDSRGQIQLLCKAPNVIYDGNVYKNAYVHVTTPGDTLRAEARVAKMMDDGNPFTFELITHAADNRISSRLDFDNHASRLFKGNLNTETALFKNSARQATAEVSVMPSEVQVGDSIWQVSPSKITYYARHLLIDGFKIGNASQYIDINGETTANDDDAITLNLNQVDVSYILNLVNFHSVEFGGRATGSVRLTGLFGKLGAKADLMVSHFTFEDGPMGTLSAKVLLNQEEQAVDIDAIAYDEPRRTTRIAGYVSPQKNTIDLGITSHDSRLKFLEGFCGSFMRDVDCRGNGFLRVHGPLNAIELTGEMVADGSMGIAPVNTVYTLRNDTIRFKPGEILFQNDTVRDRDGNAGLVEGVVRHRHLSDWSYDLHINADHTLVFDTHPIDDETFYGTVYATGNCRIRGGNEGLDIEAELVPERGSTIYCDMSSPDAVSSQEFIHWSERQSSLTAQGDSATQTAPVTHDRAQLLADDNSDMHLGLLIHANQNATLQIVMNKETGDYIALNGDGVLRANYYNKGGLDIFGNYVVDHGIYKLTIQNVIKKDFTFLQGGTIAFGGNPINAALNLKAQYIVNGVSLSDLNIGRSFSSNTVRVNCLMNITGTPKSPQIDFGLDMPTLGTDAKQMVYSLINSEEEMNQQVIYLLAIGRFYNQGNNNASTSNTLRQSQTSLALQSILSGTISQQINNVLSTVVNNTNWNFGANISTGDEGWNNAEYEGLLSGRLLNNRLLFNGQFGYRDNANATTSFIGDFDIRYLIFPNGNLSVRIYNQTNDRYFTRNSLTTQGIGLILKKDFNGWRDLFRWRKKKSK